MRIYAFRAGRREGLRAADTYTRREAMTWGAEMLGDLPEGRVTAVVETQLVIRPQTPHARDPKPTHTLAAREKLEPNTVFVGMLSSGDYRRLETDAINAWLERDAAIRQRVEDMKPSASRPVAWEDLPPKMQARLCGSNLSPDQCWLWQPLPHLRRKADDYWSDEAPYRRFYAGIKGPIPDGVFLRHKCDNRLCMNPNHLEPGTAKDNANDKMERGRHPAQVLARQRAKKRASYLLRKQKRKDALQDH